MNMAEEPEADETDLEDLTPDDESADDVSGGKSDNIVLK